MTRKQRPPVGVTAGHRSGSESTPTLAEGATRQKRSENERPRRFRFLSDVELDEQPPPEWLIDGVLPAGSFAVLAGPPASGKSFLAVQVAYCVACGIPLAGALP